VDSILTSEDVSTLRDLARTCISAIKFLPTLHKDIDIPEAKLDLQEQNAGLWMILAAISDIWGQKDLWQEI